MERFHYDAAEDRLIIERVEDVEPVLDANKRAFDVDNKRFGKGPMHKMASIPMIVIEKVKRETGVDLLLDRKAMIEFCNDRDNALFRVRPGRL